ncbi:MAG: NADH-quinone oxidoreductase subunit H [Halobacteriales archaeon]|jgi:NADH-quinone oxidoreductase subunit H
MSVAMDLVYLFVFPGFLFLFAAGLFVEYVDRKLYATVQNRVGPPIVQPFADFLKLLSKESIVPEAADRDVFVVAPLFGMAGVLTAILYVPVWGAEAVFAFQGDLVVVLFLLSVPSFALFFGGWHSRNRFSDIGTLRTLTQLFGYEVPFFLACLAPALAAGTWEISSVMGTLVETPIALVLLLPGFFVGLLSLQAKLERVPFDAPEAETEIAGGSLVEYSGRRLALFKLTKDMELVVGAGFLSALFLGGPHPLVGVAGPIGGFVAFALKVLLVVILLTVLKSAFARLRIEQAVSVFYRWAVGIAIVQMLIVIAAASAGIGGL